MSSMRLPRIAAKPFLSECFQILRPDLLLVPAELGEIAPRLDAGVVQVVEPDADPVVADRLQREDADMTAARDDGLLPRPMPHHFRRRALDAQQLRRIAELRAVV